MATIKRLVMVVDIDGRPVESKLGKIKDDFNKLGKGMRNPFDDLDEEGEKSGKKLSKGFGNAFDQVDKIASVSAREVQAMMRAMGATSIAQYHKMLVEQARYAEEAMRLHEQVGQHSQHVNAAELKSFQQFHNQQTRITQNTVKGQERAYHDTAQAFERAETVKIKAAERTVGTLNRLYGNIKSFVTGARGQGADEGGFLPGLANVGEIIQSIPQIGQLAGAIVRPLTQATEAGVKFNAFLETSKIGFTTLLGSEDAAMKHLDELQDFAAKTPFQFRDLVEDSQRMQAFGFESKRVIPILTAVGDALSATGSISKESLDGVLRQMGQMRSVGRVTAEDMNAITDHGIPAWDLLSKAIGKTVAETRKLAEAGKINGTMAVEAIAAQMEARYGGQMDKVSNTLTGRLSNLEDVRDRAQGIATQSLSNDLSKSIDAALKQGDLAITIAHGLDTAIAPVSGLIRASVTTVLGGGITSGLTDAFTAAKSVLPTSVLDMATGGVINPFKWALGINSPSKVFMGYGINTAEGFRDGFVEGMTGIMPDVDKSIERFLGHIDGKFTKGQEKAAQALARLMEKEPEFKSKLIEGSQARGINPDHLLNVMAIESTFNKSALNKFGYSGLIQIGDAERKEVGMPRETWGIGGRAAAKAFLESISATEQLKYVFRYLDSRAHGQVLDTQAKVYATVGAGSYVGDDDTIRWRKGSRGYANNPLWDANHDGLIQNRDFGQAALAKLGAGVNFTINGNSVSPSNPLPVTFGQATAEVNAAMARLRESGATPKDFAKPQDLVGGAQYMFTQHAKATRTIKDYGIVDGGRIKAELEPIQNNLNGLVTVLAQTTHSGFPEMAKAAQSAFSDADKAGGAWADRVIQDTKDVNKNWKSVGEEFEKSFASHLANFKGDFKSWTVGLLTDWGSMLKEMLAKAVAAKVTKALFGDLSKDAKEGSGRGMLGSIFSGGKDSASSGGFSISNILGSVKNLFGGSRSPTTTEPFNGGSIPVPSGSPSSIASSLLNNYAPRVGGSFGFGMPSAKTFQSLLGATSGGGISSGGVTLPPALSQSAIDAMHGGAVKLPSSPFGSSASGITGSLSSMAGMGLVAGGGFLGGLAGGNSQVGKLLGQAGGSLLAGAAGASGLFGAGIAGSFGALAPLLTNPFTIAIGAGLIATALLVNHFSHRTEKELKKAIKTAYQVDVRDMKMLTQIKEIGEGHFGKGKVKQHIAEVVRLDDVKQAIQNYAYSTGQKSSQLTTNAQIQDPNFKDNHFTSFGGFRERGGDVMKGLAYVVGERRPELFIPHEPGQIMPYVPEPVRVRAPSIPSLAPSVSGTHGGASQGASSAHITAMTAALNRSADVIERLEAKIKSMKPGEVVGVGLDDNPRAASKAVLKTQKSDNGFSTQFLKNAGFKNS